MNNHKSTAASHSFHGLHAKSKIPGHPEVTLRLLLILPVAAILAGSAHAAVIADPTLASGPGNIIDPAGGQDVDVSFGTTQATLEARTDLRVLQDYTGFAASATGNNVVSFTATTLPDIQFQFSGSFSTSQAGEPLTNTDFLTSSGTSLFQRNAATNTTSTLTISFGTWDGTSFTGGQSVGAAGFTLSQLAVSKSGIVTFRDASGAALSGATFNYVGQSVTDGTSHRDIYFGWDSVAQSTAGIGSINITFTDTGLSSSGFDDLAFTTVIPEPSTALLGGLGLLALLRRRRA